MHEESRQHYLIGLGSNMRHVRHGSPARIVRKAIERLDAGACAVEAASDIVRSAPVGPSAREYANAVCLVVSKLPPSAMLAHANDIELAFGRQRSGQRWRQRTLDLDILLWSGGSHVGRDILIPHPQMRRREFVLGPALQIAGDWKDPMTGLSLRHLHARLTRPRPLPR